MKIAACCLALALALPAAAQTAAPAAPAKEAPVPAAPVANPALTGLSMPWGRVKDILVRAAEKMPEEHYGFQPTPEVKTFGQFVGHTADASFMMCAMALGEKNEPRDIEKKLTKKADLVAALKESVAACDKVFTKTDADIAAATNLFGTQTTRFALAGFLVGHAFEHYGNMVTYMRIKGIVPPSSEPRPAAPKADAPKPGA